MEPVKPHQVAQVGGCCSAIPTESYISTSVSAVKNAGDVTDPSRDVVLAKAASKKESKYSDKARNGFSSLLQIQSLRLLN